ncbi:hypothetical protein RhiirA4_474284 [Rhizophagus irregularis]|uniref:Uncharacterized protein n=1 Tax=Rhizophagus irregularis TaxID=588596 RepID=A0A2I1H872_9GLOM|nr:hypothetical protein RhiirA4_474284 [Rhizophagus irregularis]
MFKLGDPNLLTDFREINESKLPKFDIFWEYALKYLEGTAQESILAVDERRHDLFQHLAAAILTQDFKINSLQFSGKLPIKFMEMAILLRMNSWLIFTDDKHRYKVGKPGYPVAAVEKG